MMTGPRPTPGPLTLFSFALLGLLAVLLLIPLITGGPPPSPYLIAGLLLLRLGVQFLRSRQDERLRRPASWAFDLLLIGLIFYVAGNQPG